MAQLAEDRKEETPRTRAKALVLKTYGVGKVAVWCRVSEAAVYQWLSRGTDQEPIPPAHVPAIITGAKADGLPAPMDTLWPAMAAA